MRRVRRGDPRLFGLAVLFLSLARCAGCDDSGKLTDGRCRPGNPAQGMPDRSLPELCNGIDDNCNGAVDEGCLCRDGDVSHCGTDVGICRSSSVVCAGGVFPLCTPVVSSAAEECNGIDDNCNGAVDDGIAPISCWEYSNNVVFVSTSSASVCRPGSRVCEGGRISECRGAAYPQIEVCDGRDNDCNGETDELPVYPCGPFRGRCRPGEMQCVNSDWRCVDLSTTVHPLDHEICNGVDDDCDGQTDEGIDPEPCAHTQCRTTGYRYCAGGRISACDAVGPTQEMCENGVDDDCNGQVDEGCPCPDPPVQVCDRNVVGSPFPDCGYGTRGCTGAGEWGPCRYSGNYPREGCNNHDDDCDGTIDGNTRRCGNQALDHVGVCRTGTATCQRGSWRSCVGGVLPSREICDGLDNDCNRMVDEGLTPHQKVDMPILIDVSGSMCTYSRYVSQGMSLYAGDFINPSAVGPNDHRFGVGRFPNSLGPPSDIHTVLGFADPGILTDAATFRQNAQNFVHCSGGGWEPSYDVLYVVTSSTNMARIPWRSDATPYVVIITDEPAQQYLYPQGTTDPMMIQQMIAGQISGCQLPGCVSGNPLEVFVVTNRAFFPDWAVAVGYDPTRLIDIDPPTSEHFTEVLRDIFANVCRNPPP